MQDKDDKTLNTFGTMMQKCLNNVFAKRTELKADYEEKEQAGQIDNEDLSQAQEQLYKIGKAAGYVGDCAVVLSNVYKKNVLTLLNTNVVPFFN